MSDLFKLLVSVAVSSLAGLVGSVFTISAVSTWYITLAKPALNPPSWVFGPAWTTLYILMGIAAFLVWRQGLNRKDVKIALSVFGAQLVLNALWSFIFFGRHDPFSAFFEIIVLWLAILATITLFWRISRPAAYLLLPYILWVTFAAYLNLSIWQLNGTIYYGEIGPQDSFQACTMEARMCPDGSYVGRTGPRCEFATCPAAGDTLDSLSLEPTWMLYTDPAQRIQFRYPVALSAQYISVAAWPPLVSVTSGSFSCEESAATASLPSRILKRLVDNRVYCVTAMSDGAAGSVYTEYDYVTEREGRLVRISFTLRYPQCLNYDNPRQTECSREREVFDLDGVVDRMAATVSVTE